MKKVPSTCERSFSLEIIIAENVCQRTVFEISWCGLLDDKLGLNPRFFGSIPNVADIKD